MGTYNICFYEEIEGSNMIFHSLTFAKSEGSVENRGRIAQGFQHSRGTFAQGFQHFPRDLANVNE